MERYRYMSNIRICQNYVISRKKHYPRAPLFNDVGTVAYRDGHPQFEEYVRNQFSDFLKYANRRRCKERIDRQNATFLARQNEDEEFAHIINRFRPKNNDKVLYEQYHRVL